MKFHSLSELDRKKVEKMKEMKEEELLILIRRNVVIALWATREILNRFTIGTLESKERSLKYILTNLKINGKVKEDVSKLKNQTAKLIIKKVS